MANKEQLDEKLIMQARKALQKSEERWLRDFGDLPVINYDTGEHLGSAREVLARHKEKMKKLQEQELL